MISFKRFISVPVLALLGIFALCAATAGCSAVERVGDWFSDNPVAANLIVRQAVARYIGGADSAADVEKRRADVADVLGKTLTFLDGNPRARVDAIVLVLHSYVNWDSLTPADRLLLLDVIQFVQLSLSERESELPENASLALRSLLLTAVETAESF